MIVGGGFAGLGCAQRARRATTSTSRCSTATATTSSSRCSTRWPPPQLAPSDIATRCAGVFRAHDNVDVKLAEIAAVDPAARDGARDRRRGARRRRAGSGRRLAAELLRHARRRSSTRSRCTRWTTPTGCAPASSALFEQADRDPALVERGALNFVVVGGGPTGVEVAGALADMLAMTMPAEYRDLDTAAAHYHLLDYGDALLKPFSDKAHGYVAKVLTRKGVELRLGTGVKEIAPGHVDALATGRSIRPAASSGAAASWPRPSPPTAASPQGRGGRIDVCPT